jgi:integrase
LTLYPADLCRIVGTPSPTSSYRTARDRAIVALASFSGLLADEMVSLTRGQVTTHHRSDCIVVEVVRAGCPLQLPVARPGAEPLFALLSTYGPSEQQPTLPLYRRTEKDERSLSLQALRAIIRGRCEAAGLRHVTAASLHAAFAYWLRIQGLSDHEVAAVLGLRRVRSLDRLFAGHKALDAQRQVRELTLMAVDPALRPAE